MSKATDLYNDLLKQELAGYQSYHNHKETMAWAATTLFLAAGGAFAVSVPAVALANKPITFAVILMAAILVAGFVTMQFVMRWRAADITEGFRGALTMLYLAELGLHEIKGEALLLSDDLSVPGTPCFVAQEIQRVRMKRPPFRHDWYRDPRWWSMLASYLLLALTTATMLGVLWVSRPEKPKLDPIAALSTLSTRLEQAQDRMATPLEAASGRLADKLCPCRTEPTPAPKALK